MKFYLTLICLALIFISCESNPSNQKKGAEQESSSNIPELEQLNSLINENAGDPELLFQRATVLYNNGGYQEAVVDLEKAITIDSLKLAYYHLLADCYLDNYQSRKALMTMEDAVELFPEETIAKLKLSEFYFLLKQFEPSIQTVGEILQDDPTNGEAYFMMGMNLREAGDTTSSINAFQSAIENDPDIIDAWMILGSLYEANKDKRALDYYNGALDVDPNNINALHSKAFYLQNNNDINGALELYSKIMLLDRDYMDAPLNSGILFMELDSFNLAYDRFNILTSNIPHEAIGYFYRGLASQMLGNIDKAKEDYNIALRINPNYAKAQTALNKLGE